MNLSLYVALQDSQVHPSAMENSRDCSKQLKLLQRCTIKTEVLNQVSAVKGIFQVSNYDHDLVHHPDIGQREKIDPLKLPQAGFDHFLLVISLDVWSSLFSELLYIMLSLPSHLSKALSSNQGLEKLLTPLSILLLPNGPYRRQDSGNRANCLRPHSAGLPRIDSKHEDVCQGEDDNSPRHSRVPLDIAQRPLTPHTATSLDLKEHSLPAFLINVHGGVA